MRPSADIQDDINTVNDKLIKLKAELREAKMDEWGIHPGDIVRHTDGGKEIDTLVTAVKTGYMPWLLGNKRRADGTFGTRELNVYGAWKVIGRMVDGHEVPVENGTEGGRL